MAERTRARVDNPALKCEFLRYNCDHPVFQKKYTRSNRKAGTKILRCFPHCCPEHATRCYCGCSIHLLVAFTDASLVNDSEIIVCARFEASSSSSASREFEPAVGDGDLASASRKLVRGEQVLLPPEMLQPMAQDSVESLWIRAYREGEGKQHSVPKNSILYVMNNYRFPKWFYSYESGATKNQREMKHCLRAYVLRLERPRDLSTVQWGGAWMATVMARHASPGFTLVSYRRASCRVVTKATAAEDGNKFLRIVDSSSDSDSDRDDDRDALSRKPLDSQSSDEARHDTAEGILLGLQYADQREISNPFPSHDNELKEEATGCQSQPHQQLPREVDEHFFWRQSKYAETLERCRELSVIQYFVTHAAADELWGSIVDLQDQIRNAWIKSLYNMTTDQRSRELLEAFSVPLGRPQHHSRLQHQRDHLSLSPKQPVLALCAQIAVEFATSGALQTLLRSTLIVDFAPSSEFHKPTLREQFAALVDGVYAHLSAFLSLKESDGRTVQDLVDDIVTLVHQYQRFQIMKGPLRALLGRVTPDTLAFRAFFAQARELFVASSPCGQQPLEKRAVGDGWLRARWNQRWLLNSHSLRTHPVPNGLQSRAKSADHDASQFSAWELLSTIQRFGAVDVTVDGPPSLRVESVFSPSGAFGQSMHLVLDGEYRIFRSFPNGMATMAVTRDGWVYGDYCGHFEGPLLIRIWLFAFRNCLEVGGSTPVRCISVDLALRDFRTASRSGCEEGCDVDDGDDQAMQVTINVDTAMCPPANDDDEDDQNLMTLTSSVRHSLFKSLQWTPSTEVQVEYQRIVMASVTNALDFY